MCVWGGGGGAERERERERERTKSNTLIPKDNSIRSIWTYPTAHPGNTTKTNRGRGSEGGGGRTQTRKL